MGARKLQSSASEGGSSERRRMLKTKKDEGYGILKAKKEASAAVRPLRFNRVPGGHAIWMDEWREMKAKAAAEAAMPVKKRKKVVKQRLPNALIDLMVAQPFKSVEDLTPDQLAKRSLGFRQYYPLTTFVDAKLRAYEEALIRQYDAVGYAEDETEVTDGDEEDAATATVEN